MTDIKPYTPLKTIVAYTLDELDKSHASFDKYWVLAFRALVHMTYQVSGSPLTMRMPVSANKTVAFPPNCLLWTKVGLINEAGEIETLNINNALSNNKALSPNRLSEMGSDIPGGGVSIFDNFHYNGECCQLVSSGIISAGECRVDDKARVVILSPDFAYDSILFEFIDCPEKNGDYEIPTCLQEAVIAFIKWKDNRGPRQEYYGAVTEGRRSLPKKRVILQSVAQLLNA